jgi:hypothetical protein
MIARSTTKQKGRRAALQKYIFAKLSRSCRRTRTRSIRRLCFREI